MAAGRVLSEWMPAGSPLRDGVVWAVSALLLASAVAAVSWHLSRVERAMTKVAMPPPLGSLLVDDIDNDGITDLLVSDPSLGIVSAWFGIKQGGFAERIDLTVGARPRSAARLGSVGDIGKETLFVVADPATRALHLIAWAADRHGRVLSTIPVGGAVKDVIALDLNGDGLRDVLAYGDGDPELIVILAGPSKQGRIGRIQLQAPPEAVSMVDVDRDGLTDVVLQMKDGVMQALRCGRDSVFAGAPHGAPSEVQVDRSAMASKGT
jgi:hypothetical protein